MDMSTAIGLTLQITMIGMGLVFGAIVMLWFLIALLMWATVDRKSHVEQAQNLNPIPNEVIEEIEQKRQAALAAVAVALAMDKQAPHEFPLPPTALVSAWQAVMRASNIRSRGSAR